MVDFRAIAEAAKREAEAKAAETSAKCESERAERKREVEAAVAILRDSVMPLLERAKVDFAKTGVESLIETEFDVEKFTSRRPSVSFKCVGPDAWYFERTKYTEIHS